jgi:putative ABC transport system permease protein
VWRVIRRGVLAHKLRFFLTAVSVMIAVAFISGTLVFGATFEKTFNDLFADIYRGTDAVVRAPEALESDFGPGLRPPVDASLLRVVRAVPGVEAAEGTVQVDYAQVVDEENDPIGNPGNGAPAFGISWNPNDTLNPFEIVRGGRPPAREDEVVLDKHTADRGDVEVGDRVRILTAENPREYTVVGIARFGTADSPAGASVSLFTQQQAQRLANKIGTFDEIAVAAADEVSQEEVTRNIRAVLSGPRAAAAEVVTGEEVTEENQQAVQDQLGFFTTALLAFAVVAVFVAMFIIYNTFSITVAQRAREMALLRAVGASRAQVHGQVLGESLVVGVVASFVGAAGGVVIARGLEALFGAVGLDFPMETLVIQPSDMVIGIVVGVVVTFLCALVPARQASRVPPVAAMRDVAIERPVRWGTRSTIGGGVTVGGLVAIFFGLFGGGSLALVGVGAVAIFVGVFVLGPLFSRPLARFLGRPLPRLRGVTGTLARENAARNPRRTATTAIALTIGVSLVGFITIFAASAKASIKRIFEAQTQVDYFITSGTGFGGAGLSPELGRRVAALPEIDAVTPLRFSPMSHEVGVAGSRRQMVGVDPAGAQQMLRFGSVAGSWLDLKRGGVAIAREEAEKQDVQLGDPIVVRFVDAGVKPLRVDYIFEENTFESYFVSVETFDENFRQALDFQVFATLKDGVTPEQGRAALEPLVDRYPTAKLRDNAQYQADQASQIDQLVVLIYGLLALAIFIAFIGIMITLFLSIHERTRELGLLRAVGMSRSQVRSAVRWESVIISVFGSVVGLGIGLFFGWSIVQALKEEGFEEFAAAPGQLGVVVIVAALLGVGAAILPARRAARLDVLRAIATE